MVAEIAYFANPKLINRDPGFIFPIFCFMIFTMPSFFNLPISAMEVIKRERPLPIRDCSEEILLSTREKVMECYIVNWFRMLRHHNRS